LGRVKIISPDEPPALRHAHAAIMHEEIAQRLERLEANAAHLEHQVEQLNGVLIEQGKLVDRLKKEVQKQATLLESQELERIKANITKPPHYQ
jgi:SlyX protein